MAGKKPQKLFQMAKENVLSGFKSRLQGNGMLKEYIK